MKLDKRMLHEEIKDYLFITFGLVLYATGITGFILPYEITPGGVAGIAALIFYSLKVPVAITYFIINAGLLIVSIKVLGFKFSIRTIICVVALTILLSLLQHLITKPFVTGEPFMGCVLGGALCGLGIGIVINSKGSTGGTDIIGLIINKYRDISIGKAILACDLLIVCSSYLIFQSVEKIVYSIVFLGIVSYSIDLILNSSRQSVQFFIFSSKYEEVADEIIKHVHRGCTIIDGKGWYSKNDVKIVMVMAKRIESPMIFHLVKKIDPEAFISQSSVIGIYGNGFDKIKG